MGGGGNPRDVSNGAEYKPFCPVSSMELCPSPLGLEKECATLFTTDSLHFLHELISTFDEEVDEVGQPKNLFVNKRRTCLSQGDSLFRFYS